MGETHSKSRSGAMRFLKGRRAIRGYSDEQKSGSVKQSKRRRNFKKFMLLAVKGLNA